MSKKVLIWLSNGPYPYMHYGIALSLSKLGDYEFYGIVDTKRDLEFFQSQNEIKFNEIYLLSEFLKDNKSIQLEDLKKFEKEYNLNFWLLAYTERWFLEDRSIFHKFSSNEILSMMDSLTKFYLDILTKIKPSFIIMQMAGEGFANFLLYTLSKALSIKTLMPVETRLLNSFVLSDDILLSSIKKEFNYLKENSTEKFVEYGPEYIKERDSMKSLEVYISEEFGNATLFEKINRYTKRWFQNPEPIYYNKGKTKLKMIKWRFSSYFEVKKRKKFLEKNSLKKIQDKKFIYFPLPTRPEGSNLAWAPFHVNNISIIENIARSLPPDFVLYVKEHPGQVKKNWRPIEFYKSVLALPNVRLIHPNIRNFDLISKCSLVMLINATTGLEALFYKKPVIIFSEQFYDVLSSVKKVSDIKQLPSMIRESLNSNNFNSKELFYLVKAIEKNHIVVPYWDIMMEGTTISSIRIHNDVDKTMKQFQKYFKKYENDFLTIAKAYNTFSVS